MQDWTIDTVLSTRAGEHPDRAFVEVIGEGTETYSQAYLASLRMSAALRRVGLKRHDTVVVMARNCLTAVHAWLGINLAGGIEVAINGAYRGVPLDHAINTAKAEIIVIERRLLPVLRESEGNLPSLKTVLWFGRDESSTDATLPRFDRLRVVALDELIASCDAEPPAKLEFSAIASVIYTSGTTGPAKGVRMPFAQTYQLAQHTVDGFRLRPDDVFYSFHPLFHMAGKFMAVYATMLARGKVVLDAAFEPARWVERVRDHGATVGLAHGPMVEMIYAQPEGARDRDHRLERIAAVPLPRRIGEGFSRRFGVKVLELWGMTEVNVPCWTSWDESAPVGSCGKVDPRWFELQIVDPETDEELPRGKAGEIVIRPRRPWIMMQGYLGAPESTVGAWRNLWFHTGDLGVVDEQGFVYMLDRIGDRIRRRAENISSYDIESAAGAHPAVAACAAVAVPSEFEGDDDIKLFVVPAREDAVSPEVLLAFLTDRLPHFMVPRYIEFVEQLPRTPTNKVRKSQLRALGNSERTWDRKAAGVALKNLAAARRKTP